MLMVGWRDQPHLGIVARLVGDPVLDAQRLLGRASLFFGIAASRIFFCRGSSGFTLSKKPSTAGV